MVKKRSWIGILLAVNVVLLAVLLMQVVSLPTAMAQAGRRGGGFICVTAKGSGQTFDILYMVDTGTGELHALYPAANGQLTPAAKRDLRKDFQRISDGR